MDAPEPLSPDLSCRRLSEDDSADITALFERNEEFFVLAQGAPADEEETEDFLTDCPIGRSEEDLRCYGVYRGDELLAVASCFLHHPEQGTLWISLFLVDEVERGAGFGRGFYDALERWAVAEGGAAFQLGVVSANAVAFAFWERMGFRWLRQGRPIIEGHGRPVPTEVLVKDLR